MINKILVKLASFNLQKTLIMGCIAAALYYFMGFNDGSTIETQIQATDAEIRTQEAKEKESDAALKEVEQVRAAVGALSDQFKVVGQALPSEIQMSDVIRAVDVTARASGVSVKTKEPKPAINNEYYEEIPLRITLEGSFSEITLFLFYMASQERIMKVKNFSLSLPTGGDRTINRRLLFDGQVTAYRFIGEKKQADKK